MTVVFDDLVHVSYRQIYVVSDQDAFIDGFENASDGQVNGLCAAATPGLLFLTTGLHTGKVPFTVEAHDAAPPAGAEWEEVVETSFRPVTDDVTLTQWAGTAAYPLPLRRIHYRVRYCVIGMDEAHRQDTSYRTPAPDRYLLQFWPAPPAADRIVRQHSGFAAYWHSTAQKKPA